MVGMQSERRTYFSSFCLQMKSFHGIFNLAHNGVKSEVNVPWLQNFISSRNQNIFSFNSLVALALALTHSSMFSPKTTLTFVLRYFVALFIVSAGIVPELLATFYPKIKKKGPLPSWTINSSSVFAAPLAHRDWRPHVILNKAAPILK